MPMTPAIGSDTTLSGYDNQIEDRYLGDGVYASFDGYQIWLDLRGQDSTTRIALEPQVFDALCLFNRFIGDTLRLADSPFHAGSSASAKGGG